MDTDYPSTPHTTPSEQDTPAAASLFSTIWGATDKGRQREGNEDAIFPHSGTDTSAFEPSLQQIDQRGQLIVVADGIGGAQAGREASHWAIRIAVERYYDMTGPDPGANLRSAVEQTNASLHQYLQNLGIREAGCTMAAAVIHGDMLHVANVGDSRVYLVRNGTITQLTRDHTLTQQKLDQGIIQPEQAKNDPGNHVLTRSMGGRPEVIVDLFPPIKLYPRDVIILCSDGLTDMVKDKEIAQLVKNQAPRRAAQRLVKAANQNGGVDNVSAVVARMDDDKLSPMPIALPGGLINKKRMLGVLGGSLAALVLCAVAALGWWSYSQRDHSPTATPPPQTSTAQAPTPTTGTIIAETPTPQSTTTLAGPATSTPAPSSTPTNTPIPDADLDGIPDASDACPTEAGLDEFDGCPDRDGDGIPDTQDVCPDAPGLPAFNGCPDRDGDGVPDAQDVCPDTAGPADNDGCPVDDDNGGGGGNGGGDDDDDEPKPQPTSQPEPTKRPEPTAKPTAQPPSP